MVTSTGISTVGIVAHVDAGKTSLTERLLFATGVIGELGSVDDGSTRTDSLLLERERGITIRSAVVSFTVGDRMINLIDTPGHADFIAEVERSVRVLDGAVLVVSAVEGVQPQTRLLHRILRRLGIPTIVFVNKMDRCARAHTELLEEIGRMLGVWLVTPSDTDRMLEVLCRYDDELLAEYLQNNVVSRNRCIRSLVEKIATGLVHPAYFGSAVTGAGIDELVMGLSVFLPNAAASPQQELRGTVFKIERDLKGEKLSYARLYGGTVQVRRMLRYVRSGVDGVIVRREKVTGLAVFRGSEKVPVDSAGPGMVVLLRGPSGLRIGDQLGDADGDTKPPPQFPRPALRAIVDTDPTERSRLYGALKTLAEQDPLIDLNRKGGQISLGLYGEVQQEVISAQLAESGIKVTFSDVGVRYWEIPFGVGVAHEEINKRGPNEFFATIGFRVEPGAQGSGIRYRVEVETGSLPRAFHTAIEDTVHECLRHGLYGWEVTDCLVTLTHSGYASPISTAADFRSRTPLVLMPALRMAGTRVHEPVENFELEVPADLVGATVSWLSGVGAVVAEIESGEALGLLRGVIATAALIEVRRELAARTRGEGSLESRYHGLRAIPVHAR